MYHDIETVIGRIDIIIIVTVSIVIYWYTVLALQRRDFSVLSLGRKCWVGKDVHLSQDQVSAVKGQSESDGIAFRFDP